ncbi:hypothetical protein BDY19DRAFT_290517 [Irpex rosettiformis]|uniref:Uncharacterized protein n=1 Tax=Irpex rosettiformis TaxID=378272 RepID=A0ACB8UIJ2_9APHY|nr:hypothetical protein BDY19DRAFT_290517 [Irpex rosettiformis]
MDASPKPSPDPQFVHVVCNAPLLAPKPLPYHSPTFLQFDLPDDDEDLSHPPYVSRPHKRKRVVEDDDDDDDGDGERDDAQEPAATKRRVMSNHALLPHSSKRRPSAVSHAASGAVSGRHMR